MSKINWDLVNRDTFAEFRLATTEAIAQAYLDETFADEPNDDRILSLHEMGQGRFSATYNNRSARQALFNQVVDRLNRVRV